MTNEEKYQEPRFQTQKKYIDGDIHPIKVAMREITLPNVNRASRKIRQLFTILRDRSLIPISKSTFAKDCHAFANNGF
jgi:hypothetical protein